MKEVGRTLLIADLSGYTALTETHGAVHASEIVLRFGRMAEASLEPGVAIVDRIGDQVLCSGAHTRAVLRCALRLCAAVEREPDFLRVQAAIHRGRVVEREGRLFGAPLNLTARLAAHARGGQMLCTAPVVRDKRALVGIEARPLSEKRFKNVALPVKIYELVRSGAPAPSVAVDPVCRMKVDPARAAGSIAFRGVTYHFCSRVCAQLFSGSPERYAPLWG
jgi:class 3 adenylate cyclase/YHS domain-containing protein